MFESLVSLLKRFWRWLNKEPKDLDKAIKDKQHQALTRFIIGAVGFVMAAIVVLSFSPILNEAKVSGLYTDIEYLSLVSGVCCVMLMFAVLGLFFWGLSLNSENGALYYRLRKLEKRFEAEASA